MKTETLVKALEIAKAALGGNDAVQPILSHFVFDDDVVLAYNDQCAIVVQLEAKTGINCALHGDTLLGLLKAGAGPEVKFEHDAKAKSMKLKMARGWADLPTMDAADSPFQLPDEKTLLTLTLGPDLLTGFQRCLVCCADDSLKPEYAGVTITATKSGLVLYATDNKTAASYSVACKTGGRAETVLPKQAVQLLLALCDKTGAEDAELNIGETMALVQVGAITFAARLLPANTATYIETFKNHCAGDLYEVPSALAFELDKADVILSRDANKECLISATKAGVLVHAKGTLGVVQSVLPGAGVLGAVNVSPDLVCRMLPHASHWRLNDARSLTLQGGQFNYIVSSYAVGEIPKDVPPPATKIKPRIPRADELDDDIPF